MENLVNYLTLVYSSPAPGLPYGAPDSLRPASAAASGSASALAS